MAVEGFPEGMLDRPNSGFRKNGEIHALPNARKRPVKRLTP